MKFILPLSVLLFVFSSCGSYSDSEKSQVDHQIKALIQKKGWKMEKSESGVYQQLVEEGKGNEIHLRDILVVSYTGYLINGTVFDKTKKPIELDMTAVIAGWKEVLVGKKVGSKVRFICPPHMAYGRSSKGSIPENSILIFEVFVEGTK
jgi:FKBP-type peptidyl-prolyl cis-trans isomerase FkpA